MITMRSPSTTARASCHLVSASPRPLSSRTRHVNADTSLAHQCGSIREASTSMPTATAIISENQNTSAIDPQHRSPAALARIAALAAAALLLAGCSGAHGDTSADAATPTTVPGTTPTIARATTAVLERPDSMTLPQGTTATTPPSTDAAPTTMLATVAPGENDGPLPPSTDVPELEPPGPVFPGGDASAGYGPFGPFAVRPLTSEAEADVRRAVDAYLEAAMVAPLRAGGTADLSALLTPVARQRLNGAEWALLVDEGLPAAPDAVGEVLSVRVDGLVGPDGVGVANVTVELQAAGFAVDGALVRVARRGVLTFVPAGGGRWLIDAFELTVDREHP